VDTYGTSIRLGRNFTRGAHTLASRSRLAAHRFPGGRSTYSYLPASCREQEVRFRKIDWIRARVPRTPRKSLYLDIALFHNEYDDLYGYGPGSAFVETSPSPAHLILQLPLANALKGATYGVEIAPDWKPFDWWDLKGSYSYLHLAVRDKSGFTENLNTVSDNGSSPHHQFVLQSLFNLPKRLELDATVRYVSTLPAQAVKRTRQRISGLAGGRHPIGNSLLLDKT